MNQKQFILKTLTKNQVQCIVEIVFNVMNGVIDITENDKKILKKRKRIIREVIRTHATLIERKRHILQIKKILPLFLKAYLKYVS